MTSALESARRDVIHEKERPRALHQNVVDAVIHEIGADGVVAIHHHRDLQFGADSVGARDENRLLDARKLHANMPPNAPMSERTPGVNVLRARSRNRFFAPVGRINIDAGVFVGERVRHSLSVLPTNRVADLRPWRPASCRRNRADICRCSTQYRTRSVLPSQPRSKPGRLRYASESASMYLPISSTVWLDAISSFFVGVSIP